MASAVSANRLEILQIAHAVAAEKQIDREIVVEAMDEEGFNLADRTPGYVDLEELRTCDYLVTMGCSISEFNPASFGVESREWVLTDPEGEDLETVREIRDEIEQRVETLFNEVEEEHDRSNRHH